MTIESIRPQLEQLLFEGRKVDAIKLYREVAGCQLVEAKKAVEAMERILRKTHRRSFVTRSASWDPFLLLLFAMALGAVVWVLLGR